MNLLLTSIGKRIQLIEHLKNQFRVVGVDASLQNPAKHFVDAFYQIPRCRENGYIDALLDICKQEKIENFNEERDWNQLHSQENLDKSIMTINNKYDMIQKIKDSYQGSRFYTHVNWKNSTGGHEFMIIYLDEENMYIFNCSSFWYNCFLFTI